LLIGRHKPEAILRNWQGEDSETLTKLARALLKCFGHPSHAEHGQPSIAEHEQIVKITRKLTNIGQYSSEHLFRTACVVFGQKHPSNKFVIMGKGSSKVVYDNLRKVGIKNMADLNRGLEIPIDAGELSYYLCMASLFKTEGSKPERFEHVEHFKHFKDCKRKKRKQITRCEKVAVLLKNMNDRSKIISCHDKIRIFEDGTFMGGFWQYCKRCKRCANEPYNELLTNNLLKADYEKYLKASTHDKDCKRKKHTEITPEPWQIIERE
jgi:hypothetical protein